MGLVVCFQRPGGLFTLKVFLGGETFLEELVGKDAGLGEAPHCSLHFQIYVSINNLVFQCLLLDDPRGKRAKGIGMYLYRSRGAKR